MGPWILPRWLDSALGAVHGEWVARRVGLPVCLGRHVESGAVGEVAATAPAVWDGSRSAVGGYRFNRKR